MRLSVILPVLVLAVVLPSCNVMRMQDRMANKAFRKSGLVDHTFHDRNGAHFVRSSPPSERPKLVLVHGITANGNMWAGNVEELSKHYDLIVPDLIGHGKSTWNWEGHSVDAQVAHLHLILDSLHVQGPVFLVGNSYGGAMAANYAEQHPDRVAKLVIYDGPASDYGSMMADSVARSVGATGIADLFAADDADEQLRLLNLALFRPRRIPGFIMRQINDHMKAERPGHMPLLMDLLKNEQRYVQKVYRWPMPVYVIWGEGDRLIPPSVGRGIVARNGLQPDHLIMIAKAGHVASIEQPEEFQRVLLQVLGDSSDQRP